MNPAPLRILVALDGSPAAETILPALMPLVRIAPAELTLFRVVTVLDEMTEARAYLQRLENALGLHGVTTRVCVDRGDPADAILEQVREDSCDVVALTTHGRRGLNRVLMGSVADRLVRTADIPLLVNRPDARIGDWRRVVVPLDGSPEAETILEDLEPWARATGALLHLINVGHVPLWSPGLEPVYAPVTVPDLKPYLERIRVRLAERGIEAVTATRLGTPGREIATLALEIESGLIAMTTHGRGGLNRALMGSVAEEVFRTAPCPILVQPAGRISYVLGRKPSEKTARR